MANEIDREKKTQSKLIIENIDSLPILFHTLTIKDRNSLSRKTLSPNSNNNGPRGGSSGQSGQQERSTQHNSQSSQHSGSSQKSSPKPSTSKPIHGNTK